ncbi:MAG: type II secretion system protein [Coleofasciculaceae cyanobacterium SM2_3_26]|nr:type II secretion system protein [Coleofasciculaceae cyanobacterium SM2_3_26]
MRTKYALKSPTAGFSLIEILVVIVMIGILSAISIPSWLNFMKRQRVNAAQGQASQAMRVLKPTPEKKEDPGRSAFASSILVRVKCFKLLRIALAPHPPGNLCPMAMPTKLRYTLRKLLLNQTCLHVVPTSYIAFSSSLTVNSAQSGLNSKLVRLLQVPQPNWVKSPFNL